LEGRSLELAGWMRRRRQLELILVPQDGSTLLVPAKWTDLEGHAEPAAAGTLGLLQDLLTARRALDRVLGAVVAHEAARGPVLARRDDRRREDTSNSAASGSGGVPGARGELVGEELRQTATALLAAVIAQRVVGERAGDEPMMSRYEMSG
jgi:hypothetical protein